LRQKEGGSVGEDVLVVATVWRLVL
jgi:hypothetical protein